MIVSGTILRPGESHDDARVVEAAGPWYAAMWHAVYEAAPDFVTELPGGEVWLDGLRAVRPEGQLHLGVHEGHVCSLTDRDRKAIHEAGAGILEYGWTGSAAKVRSAAANWQHWASPRSSTPRLAPTSSARSTRSRRRSMGRTSAHNCLARADGSGTQRRLRTRDATPVARAHPDTPPSMVISDPVV